MHKLETPLHNCLHLFAVKYKKSPANAKGTRDSDAYVKAQCELNISSQQRFI